MIYQGCDYFDSVIIVIFAIKRSMNLSIWRSFQSVCIATNRDNYLFPVAFLNSQTRIICERLSRTNLFIVKQRMR